MGRVQKKTFRGGGGPLLLCANKQHFKLPISSAGLFGLLLMNCSKASYKEST